MTRKRKRKTSRKKEVDRLTDLLNQGVREAPAEPRPEVLVPGAEGRARRAMERIQRAVASPREEIFARAEKIVVGQARRLLKWNEEYGLSVSGLIRTGALIFMSFPLKRERN